MTREYCPKIDKNYLERRQISPEHLKNDKLEREREIDDVMNIVCIFLKSNGCCLPRSAIMLSYI